MMRWQTLCSPLVIVILLATSLALADQCQDCHSSSVFKVKNKALYDYHVGYETSVHGLAGLSCVDCHGGDPLTTDQDLAHVGVRDRVKDPRIPETCGQCHEAQFQAFTGSDHFQVAGRDRKTLNCQICHGSMEMDVTFVGRVHRKCMKCHEGSSDPASVDVRAQELLSRISTIVGYMGPLKATPPDAASLAEIDGLFELPVVFCQFF